MFLSYPSRVVSSFSVCLSFLIMYFSSARHKSAYSGEIYGFKIYQVQMRRKRIKIPDVLVWVLQEQIWGLKQGFKCTPWSVGEGRKWRGQRLGRREVRHWREERFPGQVSPSVTELNPAKILWEPVSPSVTELNPAKILWEPVKTHVTGSCWERRELGYLYPNTHQTLGQESQQSHP